MERGVRGLGIGERSIPCGDKFRFLETKGGTNAGIGDFRLKIDD
jgi:hypothetical protein